MLCNALLMLFTCLNDTSDGCIIHTQPALIAEPIEKTSGGEKESLRAGEEPTGTARSSEVQRGGGGALED
jgi:hypothetical protein